MRKFQVEFTVVGWGEFPIDMLRYDGCFPLTEKDTAAMAEQGTREVTLNKTLNRHHATNWSPTAGRWESFGWVVKS